MSANFYQLLKYAKTGIASPDMTAYDKMRALAMAGGAKYPVMTITGVPPISFLADGRPLNNVTIIGNGQQTGTPTPDNPIMPEFVGTGTNTNIIGNFSALLTSTISGYDDTSVGDWISYSGIGLTYYMECGGNEKYYAHFPVDYTGFVRIYTADTTQIPTSENSVHVDRIARDDESHVNYVFTTPSNAKQIIMQFSAASTDYVKANAIFDRGYKLSMTAAGQTVPVYLGQVPTTRRIKKQVFTGREDWNIAGPLDPATPNRYFTLRIGNYMSSIQDTVMSSHFVYTNVSTSTTGIGCDIINSQSANEDRIAIRPPNVENTSINDFIAWLVQQYATGNPVTVWYVLATPEIGIVNEPLCKIGDYADELHSTNAGIVIPTVRGSNTLTVDTDLQPSEMSITGHIKAIT